MSTIDCTFEEFKRLAKEFRENAPGMNLDELNNAWACLGLAYIGMDEEMWEYSAASVMRMEATTFMEREAELTRS